MEFLVPISICAILPICAILITAIKIYKNAQLRADVIIKALQSDKEVDINALAASLGKPKKTPREILIGRLLKGCMLSFIGIALTICGIILNVNADPYTSSDAMDFCFIAGGICIAVGLSFLVVYFVTRKQIMAIESENAAIDLEK